MQPRDLFRRRRAGASGRTSCCSRLISPPEFQQWLGVESLIQAEAEDEAKQRLEQAAEAARAVAGIEPILLVRTGVKAEQILALIEEDEDISLLVLAASASSEGPGPLVTHLAGKSAGSFPIPIAIVPGHLQDAEIDALA